MRWMVLMLVAAMVGACGKSEEKAPPAQGGSATRPAGAPMRVAMLISGLDNDKGWNQMAAEGLGRIKTELGAQTRLVAGVKSGDQAAQIDYFASEGYDVIICHGGEYASAAATAAKKHPGIHLIVGGCGDELAGVVSFEFQAKDASYLAGVAAAKLTVAKKVGFVGAMPFPTVQACYDGFAAGAAADASGVSALPEQWTNSWDSATLAKEKAESLLGAGADVVYQNVDAASSGVFEAVRDAAKSGKRVFAVGCNSNQNAVAPEVIIGSVVIDVPRAYVEMARDVHAGTLKPGALKKGLVGGYVDFVPNEKNPAMTVEIRKAVDAAREKLLAAAK